MALTPASSLSLQAGYSVSRAIGTPPLDGTGAMGTGGGGTAHGAFAGPATDEQAFAAKGAGWEAHPFLSEPRPPFICQHLHPFALAPGKR